MDQEQLLSHFEKRYVSRRDMLTRLPLGTQADGLWLQLLGRRKAKAVSLPISDSRGIPCWYCITDKMVEASEKIVETLLKLDCEKNPAPEFTTVSTLEEVFFTSYVEGSQLTLGEAMDFLQNECAPRDAEEQLIANNRMAGSYAAQNLYQPVDSEYIRNLAYILTEGLDNGGGQYRVEDTVEIPFLRGEPFRVPEASLIPERVRELCSLLAESSIHPLIKSGAAQAWALMVRPFPDGNERLGRILSVILLLRAGYAFFGDISLSALIARRGQGYYEAMANIMRSEHEGDLTYFLEYYLQLLSYAVDERAKRMQQREKERLQREMELARSPLLSPIPQEQKEPAEASPGESAGIGLEGEPVSKQMESDNTQAPPGNPNNAPAVPAEDGFFPSASAELDRKPDESVATAAEISLARVRDKLYEQSTGNGNVMKYCCLTLLKVLDSGIREFTAEDIELKCGYSTKQVSNLILHLREKGIIESTGQYSGRKMIYQFNTQLPALEPDDYSTEVLDAIQALRWSSTSKKDRRVGDLLYSCLQKGMIMTTDYARFDDCSKFTGDMLIPEQMGLVERMGVGIYRINRWYIPNDMTITVTQRTILTTLFQNFQNEPFSRDAAVAALRYSKSSVCSRMHQFVIMGIAEFIADSKPCYRLLVNPAENPSLFITKAVDPKELDRPTVEDDAGPSSEQEKIPAFDPPTDWAECSEEVNALLDKLAGSPTSPRDRRVAGMIRSCMKKGVLQRSDYEKQGYSDNVWAKDVPLMEQLGLVRKLSADTYALNRKLGSTVPDLKLTQKKAITAIYEAFGQQSFSSEMIIATLNYSPSYTYASLHKLTLLRVLEQTTTEEGSQYQLLVNPEDHPEFFINAA